MRINFATFANEAIKITLLCLIITGIFKLFGVANNDLLIIFNMAVMSSAATFKTEKKDIKEVMLGCFIIVTSIVLGGVLGYYFPSSAKILTILYAGLAFYLPRTKTNANIFVTGALMFLIFSALPFSWNQGLTYFLDGLIVSIIFTFFYLIFNHKTSQFAEAVSTKELLSSQQITQTHVTALIAMLSLSIAWIINHFLYVKYQLPRLYWIELTILMVIQGSQQKTIATSLKRIMVNGIGALIAVLLFSYLLPPDFWINFFALVVFLFLIFFMSFSYIGRVLFIELFVLGFAYMMGTFHTFIAIDRFLLTLIGGFIVIIVTTMSYLVENLMTKH